ncbi:MAG: glycosyltransferase family 4 protein [Desulfatiglandaceae bacterium]
MKIAVVIPKYGLMGGAEGFAFELVERLAGRRGLKVHVFANRWRSGPAPVIYHRVPILPFPRFLRQISFAWFVHRFVRAQHFDVIHSHDRIFHMHVCTLHGIPHQTWIREVRQKRMSLFDRTVAWVERKGLTGPPGPLILPVSTLVKQELLRTYDIPESRIEVIHPGVAVERFDDAARTACRREVRTRHGLQETDVVMLFVGMNFEIKRLGLIIKAMAHAVDQGDQGKQLKLLVVGRGDEGPYRTEARRLRMADRLIFAGIRETVEPYYLASDFFVMPSVFDTFGMAVLEAMTAGLPVIITRKVGARDLVEDGQEGFVLPDPPSPRELGEKMRFLTRAENRLTMGTRARMTAGQHDWSKVADRVEGVYRRMGS